MAVRIISETEKNKFEYAGSTFYYRRISVSQSLIINKKHTRKGMVDHVAAGLEIVEWCLIDWEGVEDENGAAIAFSKELVKCLPDEIINELTPLLREASPNQEEMGN